MSSEGMQATRRMGAERPARLTLMITDSVFTYTPDRRGRGLQLPMTGDDIAVEDGPVEYEAKLGWDDTKPKMEREIDGGGKVTDTFELLAEDRLMIVHSFSAGPGGTQEIRLVDNRESGGTR